MKAIINRMMYDTDKAQPVNSKRIEIKQTETLYQEPDGYFLHIQTEHDEKIKPLTQNEAIQWQGKELAQTSPEKLISDNLAQLRSLFGYSQQEISKLVGKTQKLISNYENGEVKAPLSFLIKLSGVYGIPVTRFFEGVSDD